MAKNGKVLVDTSAWVDYFAGGDQIVRALSDPIDDDRVVICGQVKQELLQGTRNDKMFAKLERDLSIWPHEPETAADFREAAHLYARLRWKGITIAAADCLIAALAKRCGFVVYATDRHFAKIPDLRLVEL